MGNAKRVWMFTYGASSPNITSSKLKTLGFDAKEVYTLSQRDLKYTLIRFEKKIRANIVQRIQADCGVIPQELPGFESVHGAAGNNGTLYDHPGFQLIVHHMNHNREPLDIWLEKGTLDENADGVLWDYRIPTKDEYRRMKKPRLIETIETLTAEREDLKAKYENIQEQNEILAVEKAELEQKTSDLREQNKALKSRNRVLQAIADAESRKRICELSL